jgi:predicted O-methyltransferase YrrM
MNKVFENFKANVGDKVEWRKGYSHDILMDLIKEGRKFDFIYVDGSHQGKDVLLDAMLSDRLLVSGGIMLFDDYLWPAKLPEHHKPKMGIDIFFRLNYEIIHKFTQHIKSVLKRKNNS